MVIEKENRNSPAADGLVLAARLTADIPAAIATLGIRGDSACPLVERLLGITSRPLGINDVRYGIWQLPSASPFRDSSGPDSGPPTSAGEQVVVCRTDEDEVEVSCHGGAAVCQALLKELAKAGCRIVSASEWSPRLACPIATAAENDLLRTTTDRSAAILLDQRNGDLRAAILRIQNCLAHQQLATAASELEHLLRWSELGLHLTRPWKVVLAGPPNVGKSSLLNALVGTQRAIVHHEPGTTRDWIECQAAIDGWPMLFTDTAGVRDSEDSIEREGVQRSSARLQEADLAILVVDACLGWSEAHERLLHLSPRRRLIAWNKVDLAQTRSLPSPSARAALSNRLAAPDSMGPEAGLCLVETSAVAEGGVEPLLAQISRLLVPTAPPERCPIPFRTEQVQVLRECSEKLRSHQSGFAIELLQKLI